MSSGTYPAHQIDFAPGIDSSAVPGSGDWVSVTSKVFEWSVEWGAKDEFTQPGAGTGELTFDNSGGLFDPDNASGTYFGKLLPGVWFRILAGTTTADHDVFYAQVSIDGFQVGASQYPDSVVRVKLVDAADFLASVDLPGSVYQVEVEADAPELWWRFGESSGTQATDSSGNGHHGSYEGGATANSKQGLLVGDPDAAIGFDGVDDKVTLDSITLGADFSIEMWIDADVPASSTWLANLVGSVGRIAVLRAGGDANVRFNYFVPGSVDVFYESTGVVSDGHPHHVLITQSGATTKIQVDGVEGQTLVGGTPTSVTWGAMTLAVGSEVDFPTYSTATLDEFAIYNTALSTARGLAHFEAGHAPWAGDLTSDRADRILDAVEYPSAQRNIDVGASTMSAAALNTNAWAALLDVANAENGLIYIDHQDAGNFRFISRTHRWTESASLTSQVTIGDGGGAEVPAKAIDLIDDRIVNHATVQRAGGATATVDNAASRTTYRKRTFSETGLLYDSDEESQDRAERVVAEKKDRHRRVRSVTLEPRKSTHPAWAHVFARKLNDRITAKWRPTYGGTRSYESWIIGISQKWSAGAGLTTQFFMVPVPFDTTGEPYWIAGVSTAGVTTRPGY